MRRALLAATAAAAILLSASPASAVPPARQVVVYMVDGLSFEQLMAMTNMRALVRAGGVALMSSRTVAGDEGPGHVLTFGTGVRSAVPFENVRIRARRPHSLAVAGWPAIVAANENRSTPGLLGSVLKAHGLLPGTYSNEASLVSADRKGVTVAGGEDSPVFVAGPDLFRSHTGIRNLVLGMRGRRLLVMVLGAAPSAGMNGVGDELTPVVMAEGTPSELFKTSGPMHTLTSDTTRRDGVVSNEDVAPTILQFFGIAVPSEMNGAPIRVVDSEGPPFALHRKHLEQRRLTVPIQIAVGLTVTIIGLIAIFVLWRKPRLPDPIAQTAMPGLVLAVLPLGVASLAAGGLPHVTYAWVVPFLIGVSLLAGLLALRLRPRGTLLPMVAIGVGVLVFYVIEALRGWPDTVTTLSGGAALDGFRFYGMPNVEIGKILGASLWVAAILNPFQGFALLVGAGLFCGFPDLGANFGACITLFAAAGLWLPLRNHGRLTWKGLGFAALTVLAGLAVVVLANLIWSHHPTHGARFVRNGPHGGMLHFAAERLGTGIRQLIHSPLLWITTLGLIPELYFVLRPTPLLQDAFSRYPAWRDAILVTVLASVVALVANDSGAAAAGWGFGAAVLGIFLVPLVEETWRRRAPETVTATSV